jgi:two-component system phosphate regulon response regulator PhoB
MGRTRTLDSHASRLRRKLEDGGDGARFVVNVWGVGYRLVEDPGPAAPWDGVGDAG